MAKDPKQALVRYRVKTKAFVNGELKEAGAFVYLPAGHKGTALEPAPETAPAAPAAPAGNAS